MNIHFPVDIIIHLSTGRLAGGGGGCGGREGGKAVDSSAGYFWAKAN